MWLVRRDNEHIKMQMGLDDAWLGAIMADDPAHFPEPINNPVLRILEFRRPGITLARNQHISDIDQEACRKLDVDYTRRHSSGSAMYCGENIVAYSIIAKADEEVRGPQSAFQRFGTSVAEVLTDLGIPDVSLGKSYSVKIGGNIAAGVGQFWQGKYFVYHGIITFTPWDADRIAQLIKLRPAKNGKPSEYNYIKQIPSVTDHAQISKQELEKRLIEKITRGQFEMAKEPENVSLAAYSLFEEFYGGHEKWLNEGKKSGLGFCLCPLDFYDT